MTYDATQLHTALCAIASRCDGAITEDGVGFNGQDTKFGRRIATYATVEDYNTDNLAQEVHRMLRIYKGQLASQGIDYASIPVPPDPFAEGERADQAARDLARKLERTKGPKSQVTASVKNGGVLFTGNTYPVKDEIKMIGGRWDGGDKAWVVSVNNLAKIAWLLGKHHTWKVTLEVEALLDTLGPDEVAEVVVEAPKPEKAMVAIPTTSRAIIAWENIENPEFTQLVDGVRALPGRKWHAKEKHWTAEITTALQDFGHQFKFDGMDEIDAVMLQVAAEAAQWAIAKGEAEIASRAKDTDFEVAISAFLYPYQRAGVAYICNHARNNRGFIADEMGLGKTRQGISVLETLNAYPAVIVCPAATKQLVWARELKALVPHRKVVVVDGQTPYPVGNADVVVINYDILSDWVEGHIPDPDNVAQSKPILAPKGLIADESQYIKSEKAARTKAFLKLSERVDPTGTITLLTGTPVLNRPAELLTQLEAIGQIGLFGSKASYLRTYCAQEDENGRWHYGGSKNLVELNTILRQNCYVRREKLEVLTELPPYARRESWVELVPALKNDYAVALRNIVEYLRDIKGRGKDAMNAARAEVLVRLNALRQIVGASKTQGAIDWTSNFIESTGRKLVIFAWHKDVQEGIAKGLRGAGFKVAVITGAQSVEARMVEVDKFQVGDAQVIVCSLIAGGAGLTLTAASDMLIVEQGWTPAVHDQAEARIHRIGQEAEVCTANYLLVDDTVDATIYSLIQAKRAIAKAVTTGEELTDDTDSIVNQLVDNLLS